jgi:ferrous iron transport protein A
MPIALDRMAKGSRGRIVEVVGGRGVTLKLSAQGIVPGAVVEKTSELRGGPVLLKVGGTQVAVGRGLARHVLVEVVNT